MTSGYAHTKQQGDQMFSRSTAMMATGLTIGTLLLVAVGCKGKDGAASEQAAPAVTVGVAELVADYKANEVRGDAKYKGKRVQVTGIVGDIKKNAFDQIYVVLGTGKQFEIENALCNFPKALTAQAAALDKGATVTVDCKCEGRVLTSVNLQDCKLASAPSASAVAAKGTMQSPTALTALDVCQRLTGAIIAKGCIKAETGQKFEVIGMPAGKSGGSVVSLPDEVMFNKFLADMEATPPTAAVRPFYASQRANVIVSFPKGMPASTEARAKALVEAL